MNTSLIQRTGIACACALSLMMGSAANATGTTSGYSWTEILVPSIGPLGFVTGINDKDQVTVNNADKSKAGIYRNGIFTQLPPPPAGYVIELAFGINNAGVVTGTAFSPSDPTHEQGFILIGSKYSSIFIVDLIPKLFVIAFYIQLEFIFSKV